MNLLDRIKLGPWLLVLIFFSCETNDEGLEIKIHSNTRVDYLELNLKTTSLIIDSLRTDENESPFYEPRVVVGNYEDDLLGNLSATAYVEFAYVGGSQVWSSLNFDSLIFKLKRDQTLSNDSQPGEKLLLFPIKGEIYSEVVYLSSFNIERDSLPVDTLIVNKQENQNLSRQPGLADYIFSVLGEDTLRLGFVSQLAITSMAETKSLLTFDMLSDSTEFSLYMSDDSLNAFRADFRFTGTHFSEVNRDRSTAVFGQPDDLDTVSVSDEFTIINPLHGVTTLVDMEPFVDFIQNNQNIVINKAEMEIDIDTSAGNPLEQIRYYYFRENSGIRGEGVLDDPLNTLMLTNDGYLTGQRRILVGAADSINYMNDITIFTQIFISKYEEEAEFLTEKLVLTSDRFIDLYETRVNSVKFKIYYTSLN